MSEKIKKAVWKRWWFWAIIIILIVAIASGVNDPDPSTSPDSKQDQTDQGQTNQNQTPNEKEGTNEDTPTEVENPSKQEGAKTKTYGSGTYVVGEDIEPGLYKSEGNIIYWARLSGFGGAVEDILANGNPQGAEVVEIKETDKGFETTGSGSWFKIEEDNQQGELLTEFGDGTYIVGKDIEPGTYRSDGNVQIIGYWARLSNFTGELDAIIANGNPEGSVVVEITPNDAGFQTTGSGTWKKID